MADELIIQRGMLQRLREYTHEVKVEMKRVTWPGKQEVYGTTVMVLITTFFFAVYFYFCDLGFKSLIYRLLDYLLQH
jgi:preprotein translocase subunit SecE